MSIFSAFEKTIYGAQKPGGSPADQQEMAKAEALARDEDLKLAVPQAEPPPPPTLPFMAVSTLKDEAIYASDDPNANFFERMIRASGFTEWSRRTWAKIADPIKMSESLDEGEKADAIRNQGALAERLNETFSWDDVFAPLLGIQSEEFASPMAQVFAEKDAKDAAAMGTGMFARYFGQTVKTVIGLFGAVDYAIRVNNGLNLSLDQMLNEEKVRKGSTNLLETLIHNNPAANAARQFRVIGALATGKVTWEQWQDAAVRGLDASRAIYSLYYDEAMRGEFFRRYEAGENPELLVREAQQKHPWMEVGGSILLDPTTYMGLGVAKYAGKSAQSARYLTFIGRDVKWLGKNWKTALYVPEFGEIIGISRKIGKGRVMADAMEQVEVLPELVPFFKKAGTEADNLGAAKAVKKAADEVQTYILNERFNYSAFAGTADTKSNLLLRDSAQVFEGLEVLPMNAKQKIAALRNMVDLHTGNELARAKAFAELSNTPAPGLFLSKRGFRASAMLAKLAENDLIGKIIDKTQGKNWLPDMIDAVRKIADDMYPSVDEMSDAAKAVREGSSVARDIELAKMYAENVPTFVKAARKTARAYENTLFNMTRSYMGWTFIALSGKFPARNIWGQFFPSMASMGLGEAIKIAGESAIAYAGEKAVMRQLEKRGKDLVDIFGIIPKRAQTGIGSEAAKAVAFAKIAQNSEKLASSNIFTTAAKSVLRTAIENGGSPEISKLVEAGLSNTEAALLKDIFEGNWGHANRSLKRFLEETGNGTIEKWRHIRPSRKLRDTLERFDTDDGGSLYDLLLDAQRNSTSPAEFTDTVNAIVTRSKAHADEILRHDISGVDQNTPAAIKEMLVDLEEIKRTGMISQDEAVAFESLVKAWRNVENQIDLLEKNFISYITTAGNNAGQLGLGPEIAEGAHKITSKWRKATDHVDRIRNMTLQSVQDIRDGKNYVKVWNETRLPAGANNNIYSLTDIFPNVNPNELTASEMIDYVWRGFFEGSGRIYFQSHVNRGKDLLKLFEGKNIPQLMDDAVDAVQKMKGELEKLTTEAMRWEDQWYLEKLLRGRTDMNVARVASIFGIPTATEKGVKTSQALNIINKKVVAEGGEAFAKLEDVPQDVAMDAFYEYRKAHKKPVQPHVQGSTPTLARSFYEGFDDLMTDVTKFTEEVVADWGTVERIPRKLSREALKGVEAVLKESENKLAPMRAAAVRYGEGMRDFILHDYNKSYFDVAFSYIVPFGYWQNHTYLRGIEIALTNPKWVHWYAEYKEFLAREHAGLPDFWKQNIPIRGLPGMGDTPLFFNLENSINPYYNLLGADFNDPRRRVDWVSRMLDDTQAIGISPLPLVNWAVAIHLRLKGEEGASNRLFGRLFPQTQFLKAAQAAANVKIPGTKHGELDPFVHFLMGGYDPYERGRIGRAAAKLQMEGTPQEDVMDATIQQRGKTWDAAVEKALDERAWFQILSEFAGAGFKARNAGDVAVDQFYGDLFELYAMRDNMSPEQYKIAWGKLRERYPFSDAVLMSKKNGAERDTAVAYHVLSRLQPGEQTELLKIVGITGADVERFYNDKGDMSGWNPVDSEAFMAGIVRLSAATKIPTNETRQEWDAVRSQYAEMKKRVEQELGVTDSEAFWTMMYGAPADTSERERYYEEHPEILEAYRLQNQYMVANPMLNAYYGGMDTIERYHANVMKANMQEKYGDDIYEWYYAYLDLTDKKAQNQMKAQNKNLGRFIADKSRYDWQDWVNIQTAKLTSELPFKKLTQLRAEKTAITPSLEEQVGAPQRGVSAEEIAAEMSPELLEIVQIYGQGRGEISYSARQQLESLAMYFRLGSVNDLIQILLSQNSTPEL